MKTIKLSKEYDLSIGIGKSEISIKEPNGMIFLDYPGLMSQDQEVSSKAMIKAALVSCGLIQEDLVQISMADTINIITGFSDFLQELPKVT